MYAIKGAIIDLFMPLDVELFTLRLLTLSILLRLKRHICNINEKFYLSAMMYIAISPSIFLAILMELKKRTIFLYFWKITTQADQICKIIVNLYFVYMLYFFKNHKGTIFPYTSIAPAATSYIFNSNFPLRNCPKLCKKTNPKAEDQAIPNTPKMSR